MDEIGRGTSTFDGMALAAAIARELVEKNRCLTLFATHYFELTQLAEQHAEIANVHVAAARGARQGRVPARGARRAGEPELRARRRAARRRAGARSCAARARCSRNSRSARSARARSSTCSRRADRRRRRRPFAGIDAAAHAPARDSTSTRSRRARRTLLLDRAAAGLAASPRQLSACSVSLNAAPRVPRHVVRATGEELRHARGVGVRQFLGLAASHLDHARCRSAGRSPASGWLPSSTAMPSAISRDREDTPAVLAVRPRPRRACRPRRLAELLAPASAARSAGS